jgi:hypothetical protein
MAIAEAYIAFTSPRGAEANAYLPSALAFLAGNVLLLSSALVGHGLLVLLIAILTVDGFGKIIVAWRSSHSDRLPLVLNGLFDLVCGGNLVSQSFHRHRSGHWHHRRRLHCCRRLAVADGAG